MGYDYVLICWRSLTASFALSDEGDRMLVEPDRRLRIRGARAVVRIAAPVCLFGVAALASAGSAAADCLNEPLRLGYGSHLPDCRAYEQVSPVDKNDTDVAGTLADEDGGGPQPVADDGSAALFRSRGAFAGYPTGGPAAGPGNFYVSRREDGAWVTRPAMPRLTAAAANRDVVAISEDLRFSLLRPFGAFEPDPQPPAGWNSFYLRDAASGVTTPLFTIPESSTALVGTSADIGTVGFASVADLTGDPGTPPLEYKAYAARGAQVELIGRQPSTDAPFASASAIAGSSTLGGSTTLADAVNAASTDGTRIYFATPVDSSAAAAGNDAAVYLRSNGATTLASPSKRTPTDPLGARAKLFRVATPSGNRVFFTSSELLTDNANTGPTRAGSDLYRYDVETDELVDVSATATGDGARVEGVVGISDDGNRAYYVARGQVAPPAGIDGEPNLYLWEDDGSPAGVTRFVATLGSDEVTTWLFSGVKGSRVTPNGRHVVFESKQSLTGFPNGGMREVYRYDADANGAAGELTCASCNRTAVAPIGDSRLPADPLFPRGVSDDGRRIVFSSDDALLTGDTNGRTDAYLWSDGELSLLSTGKGDAPSRAFAVDGAGNDAFFATRDRLVPQDGDSNVDLYTARIDGGLPAQHARPPRECVDDACQGPPADPPGADGPASTGFMGAGNVKPPAAKSCAQPRRALRRARASARTLESKARRATTRAAKRRLTRRHRTASKRAHRAAARLERCKRERGK